MYTCVQTCTYDKTVACCKIQWMPKREAELTLSNWSDSRGGSTPIWLSYYANYQFTYTSKIVGMRGPV